MPPDPAVARPRARAPPPASRDPVSPLEAARSGDKRALGRLISLVERGGDPARQVGD